MSVVRISFRDQHGSLFSFRWVEGIPDGEECEFGIMLDELCELLMRACHCGRETR